MSFGTVLVTQCASSNTTVCLHQKQLFTSKAVTSSIYTAMSTLWGPECTVLAKVELSSKLSQKVHCRACELNSLDLFVTSIVHF